MFKTSIGAFNGTTWEALCQQVFKKKYANEGYQHVPASPGDFGLEGFCALTGDGFQCYCPNTHYTRKELYTHQRNKITDDLKKLKTYQTQLLAILGATKLSNWKFVTPEIASNELLSHARVKEREVRSWKLPFLTHDFRIQLHDGDYYLVEINEIRSAAGDGIDFESGPAVLAPLVETHEVYEENVLRKCEARLAPKVDLPKHPILVRRLHQSTLENFLNSDGYFRRMEKSAPALYFKVVRVINEFELYVQEVAITWSGEAEELTNNVRQDLETRLRNLGPEVTDVTAATVARHMVARWLAICSLDYD